MGAEQKQAIAEVFGRTASVYDEVIPFFGRFGELLVETAEVGAGEHVLDVAAGRGASARPARDRVGPGGRVLAVDLAPEMVAILADAGVEARVMDAEALDVPDDSFDVVLCGMAVMFFPDLPVACREWRRVLRPGGRVALSTFSGANEEMASFVDVVRPFMARATAPPPPPVPPPDVDGALVGAGFSRVDHREVEATFVLPDEDAWWRWLWSQGQRVFLEVLPDDALEEVRAACVERLRPHRTPQGYALTQCARITLAR